MQKKLVQSSLALTAAAALGLGSAFVASPALADGPQKLDVQNDVQVQKALSDIEGVNAYGAKGGELNLGVEKKTAEMKDLEKKYDNVNFTEGIKELKAYAGNDVVGGAGYTVGEAGGVPSGVCSTGFSGWDGDGNPVVLTAGHCSKLMDPDTAVITGDSTVNDTERPSTAPANNSEQSELTGIGVLGKWGFTSFGESGQHDTSEDPSTAESSDIDFAVINVDEEKYNVKNGVTDWKSAGDDDLSKSLATDIAKVGPHTDGNIQKSGRTTGLTDGDVYTEYNAKFEYSNISGYFVHGFAVTSPKDKPFSQPGDSGGAVFQGDTAVGVISGGGPLDETTQFGWVADLDHSIQESGVDFNLEEPGDETPEAPEAPVAKNQTIEPNGTVAGKAAPNADVKIKWSAAADGQVANQMAKAEPQGAPAGEETVTADAEGNFTIEGPEAEGKYSYSATAVVDGQESAATEFEVTVEAADEAAADADAGVEGDDANADSAADGAEADADAGAEGDDANADSAAAADGAEADADAGAEGDDANADSAAAADGNDSDAGAAADAKDAESNADSDGSKDGEAPAERKISIEPKEVAASDFVKKDKGVQITVKGFEEGENVSLEVVAGPENVEGITLDETANEDGVAAFSIYGTNASDPSAYLGKYDVQVTGANDTDDEKALAGSFSVVADEDGNGGGSDDDNGDGGDGGSDLPRTGAELTGLAAGAGLLVVGGAAVVLTMRRNKKN